MAKHFFPSIEKLAAYFDGNLSRSEMLQISQMAENNTLLSDLLEESSLIDDVEASYLEQKIKTPDDIVGQDFKLPDIDNVDFFSTIDDSFWDNEGLYNQEDIKVDQLSETIKNINNMETSYRTIGEAGENAYDPIYIKQPDDHSCALRSQQIVLRDFGVDIPFEDLEKIAKEAGVYSDDGTRTYDVGKILEMAGVEMHQVLGSTIFDLTSELAQGHRVIVSVDADELWNNSTINGKLSNWFHDVFGHQGGNHALVVAGVEVNPNNPNDVKVVLTDPGAGHLRIEYPLDQFMNAWKDSNCFMVATDDAAPYQYDARTGMEVPSNFFSNYLYNPFVEEHGYMLSSPDTINFPSWDYQPAFTGHIDSIGNLSYEDYTNQLVSEALNMNSVLGDNYDSLDNGIISMYHPLQEAAMENSDAISSDTVITPLADGMNPWNTDGEYPETMNMPMMDDNMDSVFCGKGESTGSVGMGMIGDDLWDTNKMGRAIVGDGQEELESIWGDVLEKGESTGSCGLGVDNLGRSSESTGSVGISSLGDGSEGVESVGSSLPGEGIESVGSVGGGFDGDNTGGIEYGL